MNYFKHIYLSYFRGRKITWLGGDKYRITGYYSNGNKYWEVDYLNGELIKKIL